MTARTAGCYGCYQAHTGLQVQVANSDVHKWLAKPCYLKTSDDRLLTGHLGMYCLQGLLAPKLFRAAAEVRTVQLIAAVPSWSGCPLRLG